MKQTLDELTKNWKTVTSKKEESEPIKIKLEGSRENLSAPPEFVESDDIGSAGALEDSDDDEDADDLEYDIDCLVEYLEEEFWCFAGFVAKVI